MGAPADPLIVTQRSRIVRFAVKHRIPAMYGFREFVSDGDLLSYGPNLMEMFRLSATYADEILKGAKPADLPIEQPTKYELVINVKTAKALSLTISPSLLLRANHVIE
jgi:putative ABC transport system substrate-binding protein